MGQIGEIFQIIFTQPIFNVLMLLYNLFGSLALSIIVLTLIVRLAMFPLTLKQLKSTKAIGVFSKIALKNQVDDLMKQFSDYYQGKSKSSTPELRRSYDMLLMKVLSLLQDSDQQLAVQVVSSREAIWGLLSDPKRFATLQG